MNLKINCKPHFKFPSVFIVSSGRSGTTLLTSILNASEQIFIPYESDFISRAYPHYQHRQSFGEDDYTQISKLFRLTAKQEGWGMSESYLLSYLKEHSPQTFSEVNSVIYEAFHKQEQTDDLLWGIKSPVLIASLDRIKSVYPQTKIIHIIRDGRDVYLSYRKIHETSEIKFGPKGIIANALYWVDGLRRIEDFLQQDKSNQIYELRYEDILSNPERELKQICDYIDIQYQPSMHENFNSLERNKKVVPEYFKQVIHKKTNEKIDVSNVKKHLREMSKYELIIFELIAIPYLIKYKYEPNNQFLNMSVFAPLRFILYFLARRLNNWRYSKRDYDMYRQIS